MTMRLFLPSLAIISLFAASSHAFAPPKTSKITTRLAAGSELSGMLSEYSSSSSVADKAVEVVSTAVTTPPPPPVAAPPVEAAASGMDSLMKAVSSAQGAADQAAAAAAAVATKSAAATKAATAGVTVAGGVKLKPVVGGVFVPVDPAKIDYDNAFDASARAKANLEILRSNFVEGVGSVKESSSNLKGVGENAPYYFDVKSALKLPDSLKLPDTVGIDSTKFDSAAASVSPAVADFIAALHLKEYAGWYVAAFMAIYASQQRSAGMEAASAKFESELADAREKANEAASAAGLAAEGANVAKKLAIKMEKDLKKDGQNVMLESSRSKVAQIEKEMMEKEMRALQAEVTSLRGQLAKSAGGAKKKATKKKTVKTEIEEEYPTKVTMKSDPDEDSRIIELLKEMDEANLIQKKKAAEEAEKKREEEAKFVAAEKKKEESRKMTKGVEAAQKKAEAAKKKKSAKKKSAKKASTKVSAKTKTKTGAKQKASTKKSVAKKAPKVKVVATADDWALLAESTLKRKTVAQLTEYLTGKGVTATDSSGKSLKKAELLEAVKSL
eukprot:CAMPEP_0183742500 /NCGR_PEP_ID=MMETSP0737-20130205/64729_1 /TAXON_ID=385413 /ORGANISM="Thalassiosira miniscula, Strain CCMP1093" /LENGTH=555 /DNA_ID=CAMNT_0025978087 /DNA_START=90 /DNA_END=1757 /DNA_ORIENTATION=-